MIILINIWGADHSGYVKRLTNAVYKSKKKLILRYF